MNYRKYLIFILSLTLFSSLNAKTLYVNNLTGSDSYKGLRKGARLPASVWKMYKKYKNEFPKP